MTGNFKGILLIAAGASSYGILATIVKYAGGAGVTIAGLTLAQYVFGLLFLMVAGWIFERRTVAKSNVIRTRKDKLRLISYGSSLGFTSCFYYLCVQFVSVSVAIVLLMQTIWMGVLLEAIDSRRRVSLEKWIGAGSSILGTALAAGLFRGSVHLNGWGVLTGLLAAVSYAFVMYAANKVGLGLPVIQRSKFLVIGGLIIVLLFWNVRLLDHSNWIELSGWGMVLGFFGTFLPPVLFNRGFPLTGTATGSIVAAVEIPVSVVSACWILHESLGIVRWSGIGLILFSVVLINLKRKQKKLVPDGFVS